MREPNPSGKMIFIANFLMEFPFSKKISQLNYRKKMYKSNVMGVSTWNRSGSSVKRVKIFFVKFMYWNQKSITIISATINLSIYLSSYAKFINHIKRNHHLPIQWNGKRSEEKQKKIEKFSINSPTIKRQISRWCLRWMKPYCAWKRIKSLRKNSIFAFSCANCARSLIIHQSGCFGTTQIQ